MLYYSVTFMDENKKDLLTQRFEAEDLADLLRWAALFIQGDPKAALLTMELVEKN